MHYKPFRIFHPYHTFSVSVHVKLAYVKKTILSYTKKRTNSMIGCGKSKYMKQEVICVYFDMYVGLFLVVI